MPNRPPRLVVFQHNSTPLFFVTFSTHQRRTLLANERVHDAFVAYCERGLSLGVGVGRYVLMPDHIHLFLRLSLDLSLAQWVRSLKRSISRSIVEHAPHWQEGFFDHLLRGKDSYSQKWEYVRQNPMRAGLTASHEHWPYQGEIVRLPFD
jgi:putative transposase